MKMGRIEDVRPAGINRVDVESLWMKPRPSRKD